MRRRRDETQVREILELLEGIAKMLMSIDGRLEDIVIFLEETDE